MCRSAVYMLAGSPTHPQSCGHGARCAAPGLECVAGGPTACDAPPRGAWVPRNGEGALSLSITPPVSTPALPCLPARVAAAAAGARVRLPCACLPACRRGGAVDQPGRRAAPAVRPRGERKAAGAGHRLTNLLQKARLLASNFFAKTSTKLSARASAGWPVRCGSPAAVGWHARTVAVIACSSSLYSQRGAVLGPAQCAATTAAGPCLLWVGSLRSPTHPTHAHTAVPARPALTWHALPACMHPGGAGAQQRGAG